MAKRTSHYEGKDIGGKTDDMDEMGGNMGKGYIDIGGGGTMI